MITLDTTAPVVAIGNPGGPTNQPSLTVTGTIAGADAGTTIAVFDGATQIGVGTISGSTWSANVTLGDGSNVLTAQVSDAAGNTATSGAVTYTLSTTAPTAARRLSPHRLRHLAYRRHHRRHAPTSMALRFNGRGRRTVQLLLGGRRGHPYHTSPRPTSPPAASP